MRVLFIGGTGNISIAATRLLAEQGIELTLLNRGQRDVGAPGRSAADPCRHPRPRGRRRGAAGREVRRRRGLGRLPARARRDRHRAVRRQDLALRLHQLGDRVRAAVALLPDRRGGAARRTSTGSTPATRSPARSGCAASTRESGFPATIVRPSYTYGETLAPDRDRGPGLHRRRAHAPRQEADRPRRRRVALDDDAQHRLRAGAGRAARQPARPPARASTSPPTRC